MSRRRSRKKRAEQKGQILLGLGIIAIAAFGFYFFELKKSVVERDKTSLCRMDGSIARETALVIDATDSFSPTQALLVKKEIKVLLEDAFVDERITLYVMGEDIDEDVDRFSVCNPGDGSAKSELTSNKRRLRQKWETSFYQRVIDAVDSLVGEHHANQSPILEMLKLVSVKTMYDSSAVDKRIVMVSDMLHHTQGYSHYRQKPDFLSFNQSAYALEQKSYLSGVDVSILYLVRSRDMQRQNRGHIQFWENYVTTNGGTISRVKSIN